MILAWSFCILRARYDASRSRTWMSSLSESIFCRRFFSEFLSHRSGLPFSTDFSITGIISSWKIWVKILLLRFRFGSQSSDQNCYYWGKIQTEINLASGCRFMILNLLIEQISGTLIRQPRYNWAQPRYASLFIQWAALCLSKDSGVEHSYAVVAVSIFKSCEFENKF